MSDQGEREPTPLEVLSLPAHTLARQDAAAQTKTVKQAYRRALLTHHPDKKAQAGESAGAGAGAGAGAEEGADDGQGRPHFTVDQITEAYTVLSDEGRRGQCVARVLRREQKTTTSSSTFSASTTASFGKAQRGRDRGRWKSEVAGEEAAAAEETVDLDALSWSGRRRTYYRACAGCGKARGFALREEDVDEAEEEQEWAGEFEMEVECSGPGCGRGLRVVVPGAEEDEDEGEGGEQRQDHRGMWSGSLNLGKGVGGVRAAGGTPAPTPPPPKKKSGWGIKLGLGLGISLGGGGSSG